MVVTTYRLRADQREHMELDDQKLRQMAVGCSILGAGGGGDTSVGLLAALQATQDFGPVTVVDLDELDDDALVIPGGGIGAPLVSIEKLDRGDEILRLLPVVERHHGKPVSAIMAAEIGGSNGLLPVVWCARTRLPLADADGMGRAFPEVPQMTMELAGISPNPAVMTDERGNVVLIEAADGQWMERLERALSIEFGGQALSSEYHMTASQARRATVRGTVSLATRIGRAVLEAPDDPVASLIHSVNATAIIEGKITDVDQRVSEGFVKGTARIDGVGTQSGTTLRLDIQNENLVATREGRVLASVPDIITVVDTHTGRAIHTERLRYGQRVTVIAFPCDPVWRTPAGLALAGPRAFGYDLEFVAVEALDA
jgi:DUF917 family protein